MLAASRAPVLDVRRLVTLWCSARQSLSTHRDSAACGRGAWAHHFAHGHVRAEHPNHNEVPSLPAVRLDDHLKPLAVGGEDASLLHPHFATDGAVGVRINSQPRRWREWPGRGRWRRRRRRRRRRWRRKPVPVAQYLRVVEGRWLNRQPHIRTTVRRGPQRKGCNRVGVFVLDIGGDVKRC